MARDSRTSSFARVGSMKDSALFDSEIRDSTMGATGRRDQSLGGQYLTSGALEDEDNNEGKVMINMTVHDMPSNPNSLEEVKSHFKTTTAALFVCDTANASSLAACIPWIKEIRA
jgi:hypothetical protein